MVHALREAHRVLKPNGILVDLRPAAVHRRVGLVQAGHYQSIGRMREAFDDDRAADRAVAEVVRAHLFKPVSRQRIECNRTVDTLEEFREWLDDSVTRDELTAHEWLVRRVERLLAQTRGKRRIVIGGPLVLRVLTK